MKIIYENFMEIADDFRDGDSWTHKLSDHTPEECFGWQHGVCEFAKFLDEVGLKLIEDSDLNKKLFEHFRTFKPEEHKKEPHIKS